MIVLKNLRIVTMEGPVIEKGAITIEGERILSVDPENRVPEGAADSDVLDCSGSTAFPGMIDAHIHITLPGDRSFAAAISTPMQELALHAARSATVTLLSGVTTVRDVGGYEGLEVALRRAIEQGVVAGPRMQISGKNIAMTGGHGYFLAYEGDGVVEMKKAVREMIKIGADWVKLMASGGFATEEEAADAPQLDLEELTAAVSEGRRGGRPSCAHAHPAGAIKDSIRAGVRSVEHCSFPDDEAIELLLENAVTAVPTFTVYDSMIRYGREGGVPDSVVAAVRRAWEEKAERFRKMAEAGVDIVTGTDSGPPASPHGNLAREVEILVEMGLSPEKALAAATVNAARLLGLGDRLGTLTEGKLADLVVVEGNPLADIRATREVRLVMKEGQVYRPERLAAGLVTA